MTRRRDFRDPTADRADISGVSALMDTLSDVEAEVLFYIQVAGLSVPEVARRERLSEVEVFEHHSWALSRVRHPSRWGPMRDENLTDASVSSELRGWLRQVFEEASTSCSRCQRAIYPEQLLRRSGGRPRRYCSNACKQAAYRKRRRLKPAPSEEMAQQQNRPLNLRNGLVRPMRPPRVEGCGDLSGADKIRCLRPEGHGEFHVGLAVHNMPEGGWACWGQGALHLVHVAPCTVTPGGGVGTPQSRSGTMCLLPRGHRASHLYSPRGPAAREWRKVLVTQATAALAAGLPDTHRTGKP